MMRLGVKELIELFIYCWGHLLLYTFSGSVTVWMLLSGNLQHLNHILCDTVKQVRLVLNDIWCGEHE